MSNRVRDQAFTRTDQSRLDLLADHTGIALEMSRLFEAATDSRSHLVGKAAAELSEYAYGSLKSFAADTYALKACMQTEVVECSDETLGHLLSSMEGQIELMASVMETLTRVFSPEAPDEEPEEMQRKLRRVKARHAV